MQSSEFANAVKALLRPYEGNFNYQNMLDGHLDISRFYAWINELAEYKSVLGSSVLSSGCGSAGDVYAFMQRGAAHGYGIEVSADLARVANRRFSETEYRPCVDIQVYDGSILPYRNESFDIIFTMHVIEHTLNPDLYLIELFRVVKPDGVIFLDVPNRYYKIEQHTLIPYLHFPPTRLRGWLIRSLLASPFKRRLSAQTKYKLETFVNVHFPSAGQILRTVEHSKDFFGLRLLAAYFHSYGSERVWHRNYPFKYFVGSARKMTTFRLVIEKTNGHESVRSI